MVDEAELKTKSKEIWQAAIKNYESRLDATDDNQIEALANLWFEYMETLGEEEDLEPYFDQALTFQPLRTIATIWMDYVSEVIDKDINRGYELFHKALGLVKEAHKDQMWHELYEAVKQDTGLSLDELKELVSSLGKDTTTTTDVKTEHMTIDEKVKDLTTEVIAQPMTFVDLTAEDQTKKPDPATSASNVGPKPATLPSAAKKAPSPARKQETIPPPSFPKKRPAPPALSPKCKI